MWNMKVCIFLQALPLAAATEEGASTAAAPHAYSRGPLAPEAFCRQPVPLHSDPGGSARRPAI